MEGFAAVLTIATEFASVSRVLHRCVRSMVHARKEVQGITLEVSNYSTLLRMFYEKMAEVVKLKPAVAQKARERKIHKSLLTQSRSILDELRSVLKKLEPLKRESNTSTVGLSVARLRWYLEKNKLMLLRKALESVKTSIQLFIDLTLLGVKVEEIKRSPEATPELFAQVLLLKDQVHTARHSCKMAEKNYDHILSKRYTDAGKLAFHRTPFASSVRQLASEQLDEERMERRRRGYSAGGRRRRSTHSNFTQLVPQEPAFQYPDSPNSHRLFVASSANMSLNGSLRSPTVLGGELSPRPVRERCAKGVDDAGDCHVENDEVELPALFKAESKTSVHE